MIIPKHKRTIYIQHGLKKEKFLLNLPKLEFSMGFTTNTFRCVAINEEEVECHAPFLNCDGAGYVCLGNVLVDKLSEAIDLFFSTVFTFDIFETIYRYIPPEHEITMMQFVVATMSFYKDWEKTGKVKLLPR